jgi:hypothetical protein
MCHIVIPVQVDEQGRLSIHTPEFRALEAQFPQFDRAQAWETRWVRALLTAWNGGKPMPASADDGGPVPPVTPEPTPEPASEPMPEPTREPETPPMKDNLPETPKATKKQYEGPPPDFGEQLSFL